MLPSFTAAIAASTSACPVNSIRMVSGRNCLTFFSSSMPFMPGILRSDTTTA